MRPESRSWDPDSDPSAPARGFNPPQTHRLWRDVLLPRMVIPAYWVAWLLLLPARWARSARADGVRVAIESGRIGWTHVFYDELAQSAEEYLGGAGVEKVVIDRDLTYLPQFRAFISATDCTHLVIDVRTGPQEWWPALRATLAMTWSLTRRRITPIVILTDASLRRHRLQSAVLTAFAGVVVTFMAVDRVRPMFPHRRIMGPLPMPVSVRRLEWLDALPARDPSAAPTVAFIGSVYPPRKQFLDVLSAELDKHGIDLRVNADKYGTSNEDYWRVLATNDIIVTTTLQGMPRPPMDWIWIQQLVFRFSEALCAGAVLVAPHVDGGDQWFEAGEDFVPFVSVDDAGRRITELIADEEQRERVRAHGHQTAMTHAHQHAFWRAIDSALGTDRLSE